MSAQDCRWTPLPPELHLLRAPEGSVRTLAGVAAPRRGSGPIPDLAALRAARERRRSWRGLARPAHRLRRLRALAWPLAAAVYALLALQLAGVPWRALWPWAAPVCAAAAAWVLGAYPMRRR